MTDKSIDAQIESISKMLQEMVPLTGVETEDRKDLLVYTSTMLEELQVASEELTQQNQTLYTTQALLLQESYRFQSLFEAAPDPYLVTDPLGVIKQANRAASELLGIAQLRLIGKPMATFFRAAELKNMLNQLRLLTLERGRSGWETKINPRGGKVVDVIISAALMADESDPDGIVLWLIRDLTQFQQMERQIHEARERFRIIFEAAQLGIIFLDLQGRVLESNPAFNNLFQVSPAELAHSSYPDPLVLTERIRENEQFAELTSGKLDRYENEHTAWRKDGKAIWVRVIMTLVRDMKNQPQYALGFCEDTTMFHEQEMEIIQLERYLEESDEKERASLARDLHDGPLQFQISLIFDLQQVISSVNDPEMVEKLEKLREDARQVVNMLRTTAGLLRSPILRSFGLERAILAYVNLKQSGTETSIFTDIRLADQSPPSRVQQGVYRIFQNGLNNALRYANASQVLVRLFYEENNLVLEIEDDGQGFEVPTRWAELVEGEHYGLVGSAERAAGLGGSLQIHSQVGEGTLMRIKVPSEENHQRKTRLTDLGTEINQF